jgi:hypothetical protein
MTENNDTKAEAEMPAEGGGGGGLGAPQAGSRDTGPDPIFVSFIYDFEPTEPPPGLGGGGLGKPGSIGGAINEHAPRFRVFTYPFIPFRGPNIGST